MLRLHHEAGTGAGGEGGQGGLGSDQLLAALVEPPDVAAEGVLVPEGLEAVLARDQRVGLRLVHVADVAGERVPGQLLIAVRTRLLASAENIKFKAYIRSLPEEPHLA